MGCWCTPDGDHGIADKLIDRATVPGNDPSGGVEVSGKDFSHLFGIAAVRQGGEADQISEKYRYHSALGGRNDCLAHAASERPFSQGRAAIAAKLLARLVRPAAGWARDRQRRGALGAELASRPVLGAATRTDQHCHPPKGLGRAYHHPYPWRRRTECSR